ncbi:hypothetical protein BJ165DRAFT_333819 [Panaeolus papilionaceus]|nr:hypothetical protein BJ165DRAFT_333819 [Panaeolus papilionaceus]
MLRSISSIYALLQPAVCMSNTGEFKDVADVSEHVCRLTSPTNNNAKMKLAEMYEILGETGKSLKSAYEVIDSHKKRTSAKCQFSFGSFDRFRLLSSFPKARKLESSRKLESQRFHTIKFYFLASTRLLSYKNVCFERILDLIYKKFMRVMIYKMI